MNTYLLDDDYDYKILILHILKKLNNDVKELIFKILIIEEVMDQNEIIMNLLHQNWTELTPADIMDLYELDIGSD